EHGLPIAETIERHRIQRASATPLSRRRFIQWSAALAGAACARPPRTPVADRDGGILIVGAGLAGLLAAYRLTQAGVPVRPIDAQPRIGGRVRTLAGFFPEGQHVELGGELIDSGHDRIQRLAAEMGLGLDDARKDQPPLDDVIWHFGGTR